MNAELYQIMIDSTVGALSIAPFRDFHPSHPILPLIAFLMQHLSQTAFLSIKIFDYWVLALLLINIDLTSNLQTKYNPSK